MTILSTTPQFLLRRGNTAVTSQYVGPIGELVLDTDLHTVRVQDGVTPGGHPIFVNESNVNAILTTVNAITGLDTGVIANINALISNASSQGAAISSLQSNSNKLTASGHTLTLGVDGSLNLSAGPYGYTAVQGPVPIMINVAGAQTTFGTDGNVQLSGNIIFADGTVMSTGRDIDIAYGNANVAVYLPTDSTITGLVSNAASQQSQINNLTSTLGNSASSTQTLTNKTLTVGYSAPNHLILRDTEILSYSGSGGTVLFQNNPTVNNLFVGSGYIGIEAQSAGTPTTNGAGTNDKITLFPSVSGWTYGIGVEPNYVWLNSGDGALGTKIYNQGTRLFTFDNTGITFPDGTLQTTAFSNVAVANYLANFDGQINFTASPAVISGVGTITTANVISGGYFWANGAPFASSNYGNTQVASYLLGNVTTGNLNVSGITTLINAVTNKIIGNVTFVPNVVPGVTSGKFLINASPNAPLLDNTSLVQVQGYDGAATSILLDTNNGLNSYQGSYLMARRARGTAGSQSAVQANDRLFHIGARGYGSTGYLPSTTYASTVGIDMHAAENHTDTAQGTYLELYSTPIGSNAGVTGLTLQANGVTMVRSLYSYSNVAVAGMIMTSAGIFWGNGTSYSTGGSGSYGNVDVAGYLFNNDLVSNANINVGTSTSVHHIAGNLVIGPWDVDHASGDSAFTINLAPEVPQVSNAVIHISGANAKSTVMNIDSFGANVASSYSMRHARGTTNAPSGLLLNDAIGGLGGRGYGATAFQSTSLATTPGLFMSAAENFTDSAQGTYTTFNTTATGSVNARAVLRLEANAQTTVYGGLSTANIKFTDGTTQTTAYTGSTYGDSNVATYLSGNVTTGNVQIGTSLQIHGLDNNIATTNGSAIQMGNRLNINGTGVGYSLVAAGTIQAPTAVFGTSVQTTAVTAASLGVALFNTTATTISMGGAAANVLIGNVSGVASNVIFGGTGITGGQAIGNVYAGNIIAGSFAGDGSKLTGITANVAGSIVGSGANVTLQAGTYTWTLDNTANITLPNVSNTYINTSYPNGTVTIGGNLAVVGIVTTPTRPAFRVNGTNVSYQTLSNVNLKGSAITTIYNQGSYFNATTGVFTAPVAGLYQVTLNARVGNYNGLNQIAVLKNGLSSSGNVVCWWETDTNTGVATHFSTAGTINLVAGDWLSANILGASTSITFDSNDHWDVTYIG